MGSEEDPGLPVHRCSSTIMAMSEPARGCTTLRGSLRLTVFAKKEVVKKHKLVRIRVAEVTIRLGDYLSHRQWVGRANVDLPGNKAFGAADLFITVGLRLMP